MAGAIMDLPGEIWTEDPLAAGRPPASKAPALSLRPPEPSSFSALRPAESPVPYLDDEPAAPTKRSEGIAERIARLNQAEEDARMGILKAPSENTSSRAAAAAFADDYDSDSTRASRGDGRTAAARLAEVVGEEGLSFVAGRISLTKDSQRRLVGPVAEVLQQHPSMGLKLLCYTGKPAARWPTQSACVDLALARALLVRDTLLEAGATNAIAPQGLGCVDDKGPRCELAVCSADEAEALRALAAPAAERAVRALRVTFVAAPPPGAPGRRPPTGVADDSEEDALLREAEASGEAAEEVTVEFRRAPLGIAFSGTTPSVITSVDPGGNAERLGVQVGWSFKAVGDSLVDAASFQSLSRVLQDGVALLPWHD